MSATIDFPGTELIGIPVEISRINEELPRLFASEDETESSGATRASLLNLAMYTEQPESLGKNAKILSEITREAACRSLLICADPTRKAGESQAWIQVQCQLDRGGKKSVCSEQISFYLTGNSPGIVRNTVFSHLDSDLPLVFWWRGEFSDSFEDGLYSRIDRLIFDSETWTNPRNQFVRLANARQSGHAGFCIHDLAFTRLNTYRQAISCIFDLPHFRNSVGGIEGVKISCPRKQKMSALYLSAWIADCLGGTLDRDQSRKGERFVFRSAAPQCPSELMVEITELEKGDISLTLKVADQLVEVSRCPEREYLRTRVLAVNGEECENEDWLPVRKKSDSGLVMQILERGGHNRTLSDLIPTVGELLTL